MNLFAQNTSSRDDIAILLVLSEQALDITSSDEWETKNNQIQKNILLESKLIWVRITK